ncbi:hypothetical protein SEPCBS57363_001994 [Sporothrix epigloea]|uniref:C6 zinc finger domain containing protein n=1 Tax=Sporothrix epigloea TaxID=1892477 RepID=A0ABP0DDD8_9PEZI
MSMVPPGVVEPSSVASYRAEFGNSLVGESLKGFVKYSDGTDKLGYLNNMPVPEGLPTPPSEKMGLLRGSPGRISYGVKAPRAGSVTGKFEDLYNIGSISNKSERDYLNSPDEVLFMQVFVDEVGVWMDSLDRDEHFSRIIPFVALKSPMILNAFLACGVKHLTLINESYQDNKALFYYNTATTQLLRNLQNPDRDIVECATTAVVLNVYEIMSEKPNKRMSHIAGARALIRECGWNAQSKGIGAACFWLNIGMEVLNCLAFNFATAWKPDDWGLDTSFADPPVKSYSAQNSPNRNDSDGKQPATQDNCKQSKAVKADPTTALASMSATSYIGDEELWVHRIFYIVAKVVNFRANFTSVHQPSPQDEQLRRQERYEKWKQLKRLCAIWNRDCPRSMRPFSYLFPGQDSNKSSVFPNIWLVKRTAIIGRLFYHTAMILLHQINPDEPQDSKANQTAQHHHAHQVCGIIAHTKNRGTVTVAIRSLAVAAHVLRDPREQDEVVSLFEKIATETGWRITRIYTELQQAWGHVIRDTSGNKMPSAAAKARSTSPFAMIPPSLDLPPPTSMLLHGYGDSKESGSTSYGGPTPSFSNFGGTLPHKTSASLDITASSMPTTSINGNRSLSSGPGRKDSLYHYPPHQLQAANSVVSSTGTMASVEPIDSLSAHSSPSPMPLEPRRLLHMVNPLMHADFSFPDHPYKAFYKPPNELPHSYSQPH